MTPVATPKSRSRKVNAYIKAEVRLRRVDDQLRARLDRLAPLRERVLRISNLAWLKWRAMNVAQQKEAVALIGEQRKTVLGSRV